MQQSRIFYENWLYQKQIPCEVKPFERVNCGSIDKGCDLSIEMLSYMLSEKR